jgi:hypothetical protein
MGTKKVDIKNYSSEQPAEKSIKLLKDVIIQAGATQITERYYNQTISGFDFTIPVENMALTFNMEAKVEAVYQFMLKARGSSVSTPTQKANVLKQAERTAWRNLWELTVLQLDMVKLDQMEHLQIMLPYLTYQGKTVYERLKEKDYQGLLQLTQ